MGSSLEGRCFFRNPWHSEMWGEGIEGEMSKDSCCPGKQLTLCPVSPKSSKVYRTPHSSNKQEYHAPPSLQDCLRHLLKQWLKCDWPKRGTVGAPLSSGQAWLLTSARETSRPPFAPTWLGTFSLCLALSSLHVCYCYLGIKMQTHICDALFETLGSWCVLELRKLAWYMYYLICNTHTPLGSRQYPCSYTLICTVGKYAMKEDEFTVSSLLTV